MASSQAGHVSGSLPASPAAAPLLQAQHWVVPIAACGEGGCHPCRHTKKMRLREGKALVQRSR